MKDVRPKSWFSDSPLLSVQGCSKARYPLPRRKSDLLIDFRMQMTTNSYVCPQTHENMLFAPENSNIFMHLCFLYKKRTRKRNEYNFFKFWRLNTSDSHSVRVRFCPILTHPLVGVGWTSFMDAPLNTRLLSPLSCYRYLSRFKHKYLNILQLIDDWEYCV